MSVQIPDARLELPWLMSPHEKATGSVAIDWDNPLTANLIEFDIFNNGAVHELVSNKLLPITQGKIEAARCDLSQAQDLYPLNVTDNFSELTLIMRIKNINEPWDPAGYGTIFEASNISNFSLYRNGTNEFQYVYRLPSQSTAYTTSINPFDGDWHAVACSYKVSDMGYVYFDGIEEIAITATATIPAWAYVNMNNSAAAYGCGCLFDWAMLFDKQLSTERIREISKNPNALLIPA